MPVLFIKMAKNKKIIYFFILATILAAGGFFRFWRLDSIPPGLFHDEAYNGIDAITASETGEYKIFYSGNFGREGLYINIVSFFFDAFGINVRSLRLAGALFGFLTLAGFYLLLRELKLSRAASLAGLFMMSFSFWHINFSRIAYRGVMVPLLLVWISYFFYKGLHKKKNIHFIAAGLLMGIGMHTYIAFRAAPLVFFIVLIYYAAVKPRFFRQYWKKATLFFLTFFAAAFPIIMYFFSRPNDFMERAGSISIFNYPNISAPAAFLTSFSRHALGFFFAGDPNPRHAYNAGPFIPLIWSILFLAGIIIAFKEIKLSIKRKQARTADAAILGLSMFGIMMLPGVLSIAFIPKTLRIIGALPAVFLLAALAIETLICSLNEGMSVFPAVSEKIKARIKKIILPCLIIVVAAAGISQINLYFNIWAKDPATAKAFYERARDLGLLAKTLLPKKNNYIIFNPPKNNSKFAFNFFQAKKTIEFAAYPDFKKYNYLKPEAISDILCDNSQIILYQTNKSDIEKITSKCPNLKFEKIKPLPGAYEFTVIKE